jgi:GTP cyclohydrolase II
MLLLTQILLNLGISNINLLSNSEQINRVGLSGYGLSIKKHTSY